MFLSNSFSFLFFKHYLVGKPNTTCSQCVSEKREGMSEREREIIEKNINRELKVSCFSSKKKQENKNSTIVKQKKKTCRVEQNAM